MLFFFTNIESQYSGTAQGEMFNLSLLRFCKIFIMSGESKLELSSDMWKNAHFFMNINSYNSAMDNLITETYHIFINPNTGCC